MNDYTIERFEHTVSMDEFYPKYVDFEYTDYNCSQCSSYEYKWSCPSFDFDVDDIWTRYDNIRLYFMKITFTDEFKNKNLSFEKFRENSRMLFQTEKRKILNKMLDEEKRLNGLYLTCGPCALCIPCEKVNSNPCRHPELMRYAVESVGVKVVECVRDYFNVEAQWISQDSRPDYHIFLNAILY